MTVVNYVDVIPNTRLNVRLDVAEAAELLATVVGQDLEADGDGRFKIARPVAKDRVISTVDPQARHGHKTQARGFDGYTAHADVDPDSEIVTDTVVTPGNAGDGTVAKYLIDDLIDDDGAELIDDAEDELLRFCRTRWSPIGSPIVDDGVEN
jgi:hypothetical protein